MPWKLVSSSVLSWITHQVVTDPIDDSPTESEDDEAFAASLLKIGPLAPVASTSHNKVNICTLYARLHSLSRSFTGKSNQKSTLQVREAH